MACKKEEEDNYSCDLSFAVEGKSDDLQEEKQHASEYLSKSDVDLMPKDTGWAWMCCLGKFQ